MLKRKFGATGEEVSAIGLGGFHIGNAPTEKEAIRIVRHAIDSGITFMDNCWDYHDGKSEVWMGKALADGYRRCVYLMSKIDGRTKKAAAFQIEQSLKRLNTEVIDLMQFHEIIRLEDPDRIFEKGGALEAMLEAQKAGKIRHIGFTGHKHPEIHMKMIEMARDRDLHFDAVQLPLNVLDAHFASFEKTVLPELVRENIGVLGMKPLCAGKVLESKAVSASECLRYALSLPTSVVITGIDRYEYVDQAVRVARDFKPLSALERQALLARTAKFAQLGKLEEYKTTHEHDGTIQSPNWLVKAS